MKKYRYELIIIAIEILMLLLMYFSGTPIDHGLCRIMIFVVGQLVTLLQYIILVLNYAER